ncbi:MAG: hypothetical protein ACFWUC_08000 [Oscillospiraceae bacterium]|jgi:hypothetical protein
MVKKAFNLAVGTGLGVTCGGTILPRMLHPWRYNSTYPSIFAHALLSFVVAFAVCFMIGLLIEWIKSKPKKEN